MNEKEDKKIINCNLFLIIISVLFFIFFVLNHFHFWANSLILNLHFCDHFLCIIYSFIWLIFAGILSLEFINRRGEEEDKKRGKKEDKKKNCKKWVIIFLIVLILGIVLMNLIICDSYGKARLDLSETGINFWNGGTSDKEDLIKTKTEERITNGKNESNVTVGPPFSCSDIASFNNHNYWQTGIYEIGISEDNCEAYATEACDGVPISYIGGINPELSDEILIVSGGDCCIWNCYIPEFSCEDYVVGHNLDGWMLSDGNENYCEQKANDECEHGVDFYVIKSGFIEGSCCFWSCLEKEEPKPVQECYDSDGGMFPEIPGFCDDGTVYYDSCIDGSTLEEWYCLEDKCQSKIWQCDKSCEDTDEGAMCT